MKALTAKQKDVIRTNLNAYIANFGFIEIVRDDYSKGFYIYTSEQGVKDNSWTHYASNIDYLNGWLYGAVQAVNKVMKRINKN